jgi:hypothetical protein
LKLKVANQAAYGSGHDIGRLRAEALRTPIDEVAKVLWVERGHHSFSVAELHDEQRPSFPHVVAARGTRSSAGFEYVMLEAGDRRVVRGWEERPGGLSAVRTEYVEQQV